MTDAQAAPLDGLRILDLCTYVAGPSAAMTLAQLGADVVRIDPIGGAHDTRRLPLDAGGHSLYWAGLNKAKRSVEIDTRSTEGQGLVDRLVGSGPGGGIVLTNAIGQPWLSYDTLRGRRDDVILVHLAGHADGRPAVDYTVNSEVGLPLLTGPADTDRPVNQVLPAWDLLTGLHAALGLLAAERVRARTGRGQLVRVALADVAVTTMAHLGFIAEMAINGHGRTRDGNYLYGSFGCDFLTADGQRIMLVTLTRRHWGTLTHLTGMVEAFATLERSLDIDLGDEGTRYRFREVIAALLAPWFAARSLRDVGAALDDHDLLWGPYRSVEDLLGRPDSLLYRSELFTSVDHPGVGSIPTPRSVLRFDDTVSPTPEPAAASLVGADTDAVLSTWLELAPAEIADLRARGIVGGPASSPRHEADER